MKFTYEDLAKAMGLKVGDRIKCADNIYVLNNDYTIRNEEEYDVYVLYLIDKDFEILPPKKKIGELKCDGFRCEKCPLRVLNHSVRHSDREKLYDILENFNELFHDQEIYDIIKKRLDKEVEDVNNS